MKKLLFATALLTGIVLAGCGNKKETATTASDTDTTTTEIADTAQPVSSATQDEPAEPSAIASIQPGDVKLPSELKGVVEVINGEDGSIPVDYTEGSIPSISITFKLLKKTSTASMETSTNQVFLYGVPQDKDGRTIKEIMPNYDQWRSGDSDGSKFKDFLQSEPGNTITLEFSGTSPKYDDKCDNDKGLPKLAKFKLAFDKSM